MASIGEWGMVWVLGGAGAVGAFGGVFSQSKVFLASGLGETTGCDWSKATFSLACCLTGILSTISAFTPGCGGAESGPGLGGLTGGAFCGELLGPIARILA